MASVAGRPSLLFVLVVAVSATGAAAAGSNINKSFNISNNCIYTVWPGILSATAASSAAALDTTGFKLAPGESRLVPVSVPSVWSGLIWGRTQCSTNATTGMFTCVTADCGSGKEDCGGGGPAPPATLVEFTLDGTGGKDVYDVSLVNGFNVPVLVARQGAGPGGNGNCAPTGCTVDLNGACPAELRVMSGTRAVACQSACQAFGSPQYCCTGEYRNPNTCKPSAYSEVFKKACPLAFSYVYDGAGSIFTCGGGGGGETTYAITFCASTPSGAKSSSPNSHPPPLGNQPHFDVAVVGNGNEFPAWGVVAGGLSVLAAALGGIFGCFKCIIKSRAQGTGRATDRRPAQAAGRAHRRWQNLLSIKEKHHIHLNNYVEDCPGNDPVCSSATQSRDLLLAREMLYQSLRSNYLF